MITWNSFQQLNPIICSEIIDFFSNITNDFEIVLEKLQLNIDIQIVWDLSECVSYKDYLVLDKVLLEVYAGVMLDKQADLWFIIDGLDINLWANQFVWVDSFLLFVLVTFPIACLNVGNEAYKRWLLLLDSLSDHVEFVKTDWRRQELSFDSRAGEVHIRWA